MGKVVYFPYTESVGHYSVRYWYDSYHTSWEGYITSTSFVGLKLGVSGNSKVLLLDDVALAIHVWENRQKCCE